MSVIAIAYGDGIGHEVMDSALTIMREAGAQLEIEIVQIGQSVYKMGSEDGVLPSAWESLERARVVLKGPAVRPEGKKHITETICDRFNVDIGLRITEECDEHPEISAVGYLGENFALFEPLQDPVVKWAGKNKAHPGAMILASAMLLQHIGQKQAADIIRAALQDVLTEQKKPLKTKKFTEAVITQLSINSLKPVATYG